jgi:hypothetical protein
MKKFAILLSLFFVFSAIIAQSYDVLDENDNVVTGTTIDVIDIIDPSETGSHTMVYKFKIRNNSDRNLNTRIQKEYIDIQEGTYTTFCIPSGQCLMPTTMTSPPFVVEAEQITTTCEVDFNSLRIIGTSTIKHTVINDDNDADFVSFTNNFIVQSSVNIPLAEHQRISIYPNPARNNFIIETEGYSKTNIEIFNVLGESVKKYRVHNNKSSVAIDCSNWENGVYICRISDNTNVYNTIKMTVNN